MKTYVRFLRQKTRKFISISLEIIMGTENSEVSKQENIKYIFTHTIYRMDKVIMEYDKNYALFHNHNEAKLVTYKQLSE